jgi:hypothetical protein
MVRVARSRALPGERRFAEADNFMGNVKLLDCPQRSHEYQEFNDTTLVGLAAIAERIQKIPASVSHDSMGKEGQRLIDP